MNKKEIIDKIRCVGEKVLSLLYPDICPFCGTVLKKEEKGRICSRCAFRLPYIYEPCCKRCGKPVMKETQEFCWDCEHHHHYYDRGAAVWEHTPTVGKAIYQFKYHNRRIYSRFFAREMVISHGTYINQWNIDLIVPIPISKKRKKQRGYNQTELLAKEISKLTGISYDAKGLIRVKDTVAQKKLNVRQRRYNLLHAFVWGKSNLCGKNILLIDDIYTTGSTIDGISKILLEKGHNKVWFLTISIGQDF